MEHDEAIERHVEEHFGPIEFVMHEVGMADRVHVLVVGPTEGRPYRTLVTEGMSGRPMRVPEGVSPLAELMIGLPADWPLPDDGGSWPVHLLKYMARFPHERETWLGAWHLVPNGDPVQPYAPDTPFAGVVVTPMLDVEPEARVIESSTAINLLALVPLHQAEVALKIDHGTDALIATLDRGEVSEVFDPDRPCLL
ncbi:suppressor of fused domain protein [Nocardia sp. CA-145437]|uniref:suppressor of fused domain protein n=1 Tax=Nocardia sp. CA-145437 TaxID=3239980 RepID=UPI003D970CE9